jgi:hypothetical protein
MTSCQHCLGVPSGSRATCSCGRGLAWYQPSKQQIAAACERIQATWGPQRERARRDADVVLECPVARDIPRHERNRRATDS